MTEENVPEVVNKEKAEKEPKFFVLWLSQFWNKHGERLVYLAIANAFAYELYQIGLKEAATTIVIGSATLAFNKARGNGQPPPEKT